MSDELEVPGVVVVAGSRLVGSEVATDTRVSAAADDAASEISDMMECRLATVVVTTDVVPGNWADDGNTAEEEDGGATGGVARATGRSGGSMLEISMEWRWLLCVVGATPKRWQ